MEFPGPRFYLVIFFLVFFFSRLLSFLEELFVMSEVSEATNTSTVPAFETLATHVLGELPNIQVAYRLSGKNYLQWSQLV